MIIIDSSVWIASLNKQEINYSRSKELITKLANDPDNTYGEVWVSRYVIQETITRVLYQTQNQNKQKIIEMLWANFSKPEILNEMELDEKTRNKIFNRTYRLVRKCSLNKNPPSFIDCYLVEFANELADTFPTKIFLAYFDQWFPHGDYIPVFEI